MNIRKIIQFLALGLILIILPIGSWVYLRKGYYDRKDALDQLKYDLPLADFQLKNQKGELISKPDLQGGFAVLGKIDEFAAETPIIKASKGLFEEFGSSLRMVMLTQVDSYDSLAINGYINSMSIDTTGKWYFVEGSSVFDKVFQTHSSKDHLALIDTFGVVRNYYNVNNEAEIAEMAKHIAMFVMPLMKKRGDLVYKREEEK